MDVVEGVQGVGAISGQRRSEVASQRAAGRRWLPAIDGLRGIAIAAVIAYHLNRSWLPGGYLGVDIFFVISGFLITGLLLDALAPGQRAWPALKNFWSRRARRLVPALVLMIAVVAVAASLAAPDAVPRLRADVPAGLTFLENWRLLLHHDSYFEGIGRPPLLQHLWSLGVEEQFYLAWPWAVLLICRWSKSPAQALWPLAAAGAAGSGLLMALLYVPGQDGSAVYYDTFTHASGLMIGAAAAAFVRAQAPIFARWRSSSRAWWGAGSLAGLALMTAFMTDSATFTYRGGIFLASLLAGIALLVGLRPGPVTRVLGLRPLRYLGSRSYSLYLWHWPVICLTRPDVDIALSGWPLLTFRLALIGALSEASFRLVEQPFRSGRAQQALASLTYRGRRVALGSAGACGVAVISLVALTNPAPITGALAAGSTPAARAVLGRLGSGAGGGQGPSPHSGAGTSTTGSEPSSGASSSSAAGAGRSGQASGSSSWPGAKAVKPGTASPSSSSGPGKTNQLAPSSSRPLVPVTKARRSTSQPSPTVSSLGKTKSHPRSAARRSNTGLGGPGTAPGPTTSALPSEPQATSGPESTRSTVPSQVTTTGAPMAARPAGQGRAMKGQDPTVTPGTSPAATVLPTATAVVAETGPMATGGAGGTTPLSPPVTASSTSVTVTGQRPVTTSLPATAPSSTAGQRPSATSLPSAAASVTTTTGPATTGPATTGPAATAAATTTRPSTTPATTTRPSTTPATTTRPSTTPATTTRPPVTTTTTYSSGTSVAGATTSAKANTPKGHERHPDVLAIGDSVLLAASGALEQRLHHDITVDAVVGRQVYEGIYRLEQYRKAGDLTGLRAVVIDLGTNGPMTPADVAQIRQICSGVPLLVFVNVRVPLPWQSETNSSLAAVAHQPGIKVVNWFAASAAPGVLWPDAVHPDPKGQALYARLVAAALGA